MKNYEKPIIKINYFEAEDVMTISAGGLEAAKFNKTIDGLNEIEYY